MPKLEVLAKELESLGKANLKDVIAHVRDDNYSRERLIKELIAAKCRFFAGKLATGVYDAEEVEAKTPRVKAVLEKRNALKQEKLKAKADLLKSNNSKKVKKGAIKNDTRKISKTTKKD